MFKFYIDKEAIDLLCEIMKNNRLSEIEVKFSLLAATHFLVNQPKEFGVGSRLTST